MTAPAADVDLLHALDFTPRPRCDWRNGHPGECTTPADWYVTYEYLQTVRRTHAFCNPHRIASARITAPLPIDIIAVERVR